MIYSRLHSHVPIGEFGPAVEAMGYETIWVTEGPVNEQAALDPLVALQAFADSTDAVRIGTGVLILPLRDPVLLAKQVASIDLLSGGRTILGVGVGGSANSGRAGFDACGIPLRGRGRRADEALAVMTKLWSGRPVSHQGECFHLDGVTMEPRPAQRPHPPIWVGGGGAPATLRRVARWGSGWMPTNLTVEEYASAWRSISALAAEEGRSPGSITKGVHLYVSLDRDPIAATRAAERTLSERYGFACTAGPDGCHAFGTPADCIDTIERYRAIGVTHFVVNVARPLREVFDQIETFRHEVMAPFAPATT